MTPDNNNENSRMEDILTGMLNNTPSSELPEAHSRVEELLLQVLDKMNAGGGGGGGGAGSLMVEVTNPDGGGYEYRMNKTAGEIYEAFAAGKTIIGHLAGEYFGSENIYGLVDTCSTENGNTYLIMANVPSYGCSYATDSLSGYPHFYND